ncbi:MAG: ATP-binding protein [Caldilineaceae bacterium]
MSSLLAIRLFDNFQLTYDGKHIANVKSASMRSLLAYLLLHRDVLVQRRRLAYLLWPDSTEVQARTNLRRELHYLRRALPDVDRFLVVKGQGLQWRCDSPFHLDVAEFEAAIKRIEDVDQSGDTTNLQTALEEAVLLYTGDLLPGCYDDWIVPEREWLSQLYLRQLERLIRLLEGNRDYRLAIGYAQRLLSHDPLHETTYRYLMRLHTLNGERALALRVYHTCVTTLKSELDADPSPATREIYERLVNADSASTPPQSPSQQTLVGEGRLIGRGSAWETMQAAWQKTTSREGAGHVHFVSVTGDAGIGKTRLVEEMLAWAERQEIATARTRCFPVEGQLTYAPVADLLRADFFLDVLPALDDVWLTEVARILPGLLVERPELPRPRPITESGQRLRLFKALARVVMACGQPLLLAIDDLQWCDRESLEWVHYLMRLSSRHPLLILGTARTEDLAEEHPLRSVVADLRRTEQVTEIELRPLSSDETAQLAAQVLGRELDSELASELYVHTEGNPLFVEEVVRAQFGPESVRNEDLKEDSISGSSVGIARKAGYLRTAELPASVHAVIRSRLERLSARARALTELAATIGRSFTYDVLAHASAPQGNLLEEELVNGLDELWNRRIIREQGEDAYDFSHDMIRGVVYTQISKSRRRLLHRRVALALESVHASALDQMSGQIAVHYERGGMLRQAISYYQRAAETARCMHANQEALSLYARALQASQHVTPSLDEAQLLPLYKGRALAYRSLTQLDEAIANLEIMYRLAHDAGLRQMEGVSLYELAYTNWLTFSEGNASLVEEYAQEAMALFDQTGDLSIQALALTMLGAVDQVRRNLTDAGRKLKEALEISRQAGDRYATVQALSFLCLQASLQARTDLTMEYTREGVTAAQEVGDGINELRMLAFQCQGLWSAGRYSDAFALARQVMAEAEERGNAYIQARMSNTLGWFHHELGSISDAVAYNQASIEIGRASGIANVEISALVNLGSDYLASSQPARALAIFEPTLTRVEREGVGAHKWRWRMKLLLELAAHAYAIGDPTQALRYVDEALDEALATSSRKYVAQGTALRGKILMKLGNTEGAGAELKRASSLAESLHDPSLSRPLAFALGQWYESLGRTEDASAQYGKAQRIVEQITSDLDDDELRNTFLLSEPVQSISLALARTL